MKLRSPSIVSLLVFVRVGREPLALVLGRRRIVGEVAGPGRAEREVVRCTGAPAQLLPELLEHQSIASIASWTSPARNGRPRTRLKPAASTRNSARISLRSWPRLISGISTFS